MKLFISNVGVTATHALCVHLYTGAMLKQKKQQ